jgi:hypothetical protein
MNDQAQLPDVRGAALLIAVGLRLAQLCAIAGKSGRGLPQSKTLRAARRPSNSRSVLDCSSPLELFVENQNLPISP